MLVVRSQDSRQQRRYERGGIVLPIAAFSCLASILFGTFCFFEGLASVERVRTQARADALALGTAVSARVYGVDFRCHAEFGGPFLERLYALNGGEDGDICPEMFEREHGELSSAHGFAVAGVGSVEDEFIEWEMDIPIVRNGRAARIFEIDANYDDFIPEYPNIELVLDYSRSMDAGLNGFNKLQRLREAVSLFFENIERRFQVGLIIFASDVMSVRPLAFFTDAHVDSIITAVNTTDVGRTADTGMTNYRAALRRARQELNNDGSPFRNVIFVSDGRPTVPNSREVAAQLGIAEGQQLRAEGANIFGLFIGEEADSEVMSQIVTPPEPGEPEDEFFVRGNDTAVIAEFFRKFEVFYLCRLPIDDTWDNTFPPAHTSAWLRDNAEAPGVPVTFVQNDHELLDPDMNVTFAYTILKAPPPIDEFSVYASKAVCEWLEANEERRFVMSLGHSLLAGIDTPL